MARAKTDRWVDKTIALRTLADMEKPCTDEEFQKVLGKQGFRMKDDYRAYNILDRLRRQDLAVRLEDVRELEYPLKLRNGAVRTIRRRQSCSRWEITLKGRERLRWLALKPRG